MTSTMSTTTNPERARPARGRAGVLAGLLLFPLAASPLVLPVPARAGAQSANQLTARQTLEKALDQVSGILLSDEIEKQAKRRQVQDLIERNVDFDTVSRLVLAQSWKRFSDQEKPRFVALFKRHLLATYWRNADYSDFRGIEVIGDRKEERRDWTVQTVVKNKSSEDVRIDYRLRQDGKEGDPGGEWRIIDILVEGVSLISNFRSQFQSIVNNSGPAKLIEDLEKKVAEEEKAESKGNG